MANIISTLGHDLPALKRSAETAFAQTSSEIDKLRNEVKENASYITTLEARIADLEARVTALEGP